MFEKKTLENSINASLFRALKVSEDSQVPLLIMANPGVGKTTTVQIFADLRGYSLVSLHGNSESAESINGYDTVPSDITSKTEMPEAKRTIPTWFNEVLKNNSSGKKTLLFLDEITTSNVFVQAALLKIIFERKVHNTPLPESTLVVAAGNYFQNLSTEMNVLPPILNRFMIFNITPTIGDLKFFLNKFEGAISSGTKNDFDKDLKNVLKKIDKEEVKISEKIYNIIGERVERSIIKCTEILSESGKKKLDLSEIELSGIYSEENLDNKLYGFATLRTLCYLSRVTLSTVRCFGPRGLESPVFKELVKGLVGISVIRTKKESSYSTVETSYVGDDFIKHLLYLVPDIQKDLDQKLQEYGEFFMQLLDSTSDEVFKDADLISMSEKLGQLFKGKDFKKVRRPLDSSIIVNIIGKLSKNFSQIKSNIIPEKNLLPGESILKSITNERLLSEVNHLNNCIELHGRLHALISEVVLGYESDLLSKISSFETDITKSCSIVTRFLNIQKDSNLISKTLIPEIIVPKSFNIKTFLKS